MADPIPAPTPAKDPFARLMLVGMCVGLLLMGGWAYLNRTPADVAPAPTPQPTPKTITVKATTGAGTIVKLPGIGEEVFYNFPKSQEGKIQIFEYVDHFLVVPQVDGTYYASATIFDKGAWQHFDWLIVAGKGPIPPPVPPTPPTPPPVPPTPPTPPVPPIPDPPIPPTPPAPIPYPGFRVLVVFDQNAGAAKLTKSQYNELYGAEVANYLNAKCVKDAKGQPEWRIWDAATPLANAPEIWRQAMGRTRTSLPWIVVSDGISGFEGPLPDGGGILPLLKKWGK